MKLIFSGFRPGYKLTLFVIVMLPVLVLLGFWQLEREEQKRELQTSYQQRLASPSQSITELPANGDLLYRPVTLYGQYDNAHLFLLDNRTWQGQAGFEVLSPFRLAAGGWVLVNRGWVPQGRTRQDIPVIEPVLKERELEGYVYQPPGDPLMLGAETPFSGWPRVRQIIDVPAMGAELDLDQERLFPYSVRLAENQAGGFVRNWQIVATDPERHRAYAVQWFAMAAVLLGLYFYSGFKRSVAEDTNSQSGGPRG